MKREHTTMLIACLVLCMNSISAQVKQKLNIEAATVFLNSASITSSAKVTIQAGEHDIIFTNVADDIDEQNIIVNATNGVVVEATTLQDEPADETIMTQKIKEMKDSIEIITNARAFIEAKIELLDEQILLIQTNRKLSVDNTGQPVAELSKMIELTGTKMGEFKNERIKQRLLLKKADDRIAQLKLQINAEQKKGIQQGGQLRVTLYSEKAVTTNVTITYIIADAGWTPTYDIMAVAVNTPVKLFYKANVHQNSGLKWDNIKLTLSTGNPAEGVQPPTMAPWYVSLYVPATVYVQQKSVQANVQYNSRVYKREDIAVMPTTQVIDIASTSAGVYQQQRSANLNMNGSRSTGTMYIIDGVQVRGQSSVDNYTTVSNIGVNTTFDIDLPYSIPSDDDQHMVTIKKYEMPATYRYYTVPKLDKDAFLQAEITNWEDMNLLPGQTNIFYEGTFIGQGYIDIRNTTDTMLLSLGRDKKVIVQRERDKKMRSVKTFGANVREEFAYTITIRNNRKAPITLVIQDQLPVSNDKNIVIEDTETSDSQYNEETGMMKWTLSPGAGEAKKVNFAFTIKYPRDKNLVGFR